LARVWQRLMPSAQAAGSRGLRGPGQRFVLDANAIGKQRRIRQSLPTEIDSEDGGRVRRMN